MRLPSVSAAVEPIHEHQPHQLHRDVEVGAQAPHDRTGAAQQRLRRIAVAAIHQAHAAVQVHLPGEARAAEALRDLGGALDRRFALGDARHQIPGHRGPLDDAEQKILAIAFLGQLEQGIDPLEEADHVRGQLGPPGELHHETGEPAQQPRLGVADTLRQDVRSSLQGDEGVVVVGEDQQVGEPEGHPQGQQRLAVAERLQALAQQLDRCRVVGADLPAEAHVAPREAKGGASQRDRVADRPRHLDRGKEGAAGADQVGAEQLLLAEFEQRRRPRGRLALGQQGEHTAHVRGGLLVIVSLGGRRGGGPVGGDRRLGARQLHREAEVARQLGRLRLGIALQRPGDRQVQPSAGGIAGSRDQRLTDQRVREGDRRPRCRHVVDQPLRQSLVHGALRLFRAEPGGLGRKRDRRRGPDRSDRGEETLGVGVQPG